MTDAEETEEVLRQIDEAKVRRECVVLSCVCVCFDFVQELEAQAQEAEEEAKKAAEEAAKKPPARNVCPTLTLTHTPTHTTRNAPNTH